MKTLFFIYGFTLAILQKWFLPVTLLFVVVAFLLGVYLVRKRENRARGSWLVFTIAYCLLPVASSHAQPVSVSFNLSWLNNAPSAQGVYIYRDGLKIATVGANVAAYSDLVTGNPGEMKSYQVSAFMAGIESAKSAVASAMIPAVVSLVNAPGGLSVAAISSQTLRISWSDESDNETGFDIEGKKATGNSPYSPIATVGPNITTYDWTGLGRYKTYCARVRARAGQVVVSGYAGPLCATTSK